MLDSNLTLIVSIGIAVLSGLGIWVLKLDNRQYRLQAEVVTKTELNALMQKMEAWLVRIEQKLDEVIKDRASGS